MHVMVFYDGIDYYRRLKAHDPRLRTDLAKLTARLVEVVEERESSRGRLSEARYYSGTQQEPNPETERVLEALARLDGFTVPRLPHQAVGRRCPDCGQYVSVSVTHNIQIEIATDLVYFAAEKHYDVAVLVATSVSLASAVKAAKRLGSNVYVAAWSLRDVPSKLQQAAYGLIDLSQEVESFRHGSSARTSEESSDMDSIFLRELACAEEKFSSGYVGLNFFLSRWKGQGFAMSRELRQEALNRLIERGMVEVYDARDNRKALRLTESPAGQR